MKAKELIDLLNKRIDEYGDFDVRFDNYNVKDVKFVHQYFANRWFEIMT